VPFRLPEYEDAYKRFAGDALDALARARDPLLREIRVERVSGAPASRIVARDGMDVDLSSSPIGTEHSIDFPDVVAGDLERLVIEVDRGSEQLTKQMADQLFEVLGKVTAATGNVLDAKGAKFSWDLVLECLEMTEWGTDDDGNVQMPTFVAGPDVLAKAPPATPAQTAALEQLKQRKQEEADARRRHRRLS
jgi:hypothetical protein